jgi:serine protease AprX
VVESYKLDPLCQAVERAWKAGIVVVVAAGNNGRDQSMGTNGYGTIGSPANSPWVITVGAMRDMGTVTRTDDRIASYSSKGPTALDHVVKPDLVAPGNRIISAMASATSTIPAAQPTQVILNSYYRPGVAGASPYMQLSGTSMAAPVVAGAAALLLHKDPSLSPDTIKARLMKTATKVGMPSQTTYQLGTALKIMQRDVFTVGAGYLDVWAALNATDVVPVTLRALSPKAMRDSLTGKVRLSGSNVIWGDNVIWGENVIWGDNVIWGESLLVTGTNVIWGESFEWGNTGVSGYNVIWGTNVLWGTSVFPIGLSAEGDSDSL